MQVALKVYETLWQVACISHTATHGLRLSARQPAMLWTHTDGQRDAQCCKARPYCSTALQACTTVLQALQQGFWQATYASLTATEGLPCEPEPSDLALFSLLLVMSAVRGIVRSINDLPLLCPSSLCEGMAAIQVSLASLGLQQQWQDACGQPCWRNPGWPGNCFTVTHMTPGHHTYNPVTPWKPQQLNS